MLSFVLTNNFALYLAVLTFVLLVSTTYYFWFVYKPYSEFPAWRLEHRIPYWKLTGEPLNKGILQTFIKGARRYESEGVFAAWLGAPFLIAYGEEIVKKIVNEPAAIDKPHHHYKLFEFAAGRGILTSNGEDYKKQWKMSAPAFHVKAVKTYTTIMNKHSEELVRMLSGLDRQPTEDIYNIIGVCSMGVILESNIGEQENYLEEYAQIIKFVQKIADYMSKRVWSPWLHIDFVFQLLPMAREARNIFKDYIQPRLENVKESLISRQASPPTSASDLGLNGKRLKPMGESLVEQHLQDPTITMEEVSRQIGFIIAAGYDTVTVSVTYALYLLGKHQEMQDRAFEEVMSETKAHVTYDDLQRLTYLECVIKETLRLYPVPFFGRYLRKDLQCGQYKIPQNSTVYVFPYMLHRNPKIYPDPETFDPERFMDKNSRIKPWHYVPFAEGLRPCIGKNYAMVQMKIILAHVLRNFRVITLNQIEEVDLSWAIILECTKNTRMQFLPRDSLQS